MNVRYSFIFIIVLLMSSTTLLGSTITRDFNETYDFDGDLISVKTTNGNIFVKAWDRDEVEVNAEIEVRASSKSVAREFMDQVEVVVRERGDELIIRVEHPDQHGGGFMDWFFGAGKPSVSVNFWLNVPEYNDISASSVNGNVEIVGIEGKAELSTTNGKIVAEEINGPVDASTTNGSISVEIRSDELEDDIRLHTVNGSIKLALDEDMQADIDISTVNGSIHTDFPLEVQGKWGPKSVSGEVNGGGALIDLETVNGSVTIMER